MIQSLNKDQVRSLGKFRLVSERTDALIGISGTSLLKSEQLKGVLKSLQEYLALPSLKVAASIFVKRYSFFILVHFYALSVWKQRLLLSAEDIELEVGNERERLWIPSFYASAVSYEMVPEFNHLSSLEAIIETHIVPIFHQLQSLTNIPQKVMWENLYVYVKWMYEQLLEDDTLSSIHKSIQADYDYLMGEAQGALFGAVHNPFKQFRSLQGKRQTCCYSYCMEKKKYCSNCPIINDQKEEKRNESNVSRAI
ncbi:IucA/IucC family C-terminal-domain containing protein [Priestia koreensis]|uniref:IucA/IucC family C-terminal-domain containing protein n=1 Tax=Priestia koreensis TaxID=284581 RepID=UPI0028F71075|nr:IucA/IucC family C-terminal-domain containing protein [Priestia koreensis]